MLLGDRIRASETTCFAKALTLIFPQSPQETPGTMTPFCVLNATKNALQIMSLAAYASEEDPSTTTPPPPPPPPAPVYYGEGMTLRVRPRLKQAYNLEGREIWFELVDN